MMTETIVHVVHGAMSVNPASGSKEDVAAAYAHAHASLCADLAQKLANFCESKQLVVYTISSPTVTFVNDVVVGALACCLQRRQRNLVRPLTDSMIDQVDKLGGSVNVTGEAVVPEEVLQSVIGDNPEFADVDKLREQIQRLTNWKKGSGVPPASNVPPGNSQPGPSPNMSGLF